MKKLLLLALLTVSGSAFAQNVGIGTNKPDESAILDLKSSNKGFLLPRLTEKQKGLIPQPAEGLMIYQTDSNQGVYLYQGGNWKNIGNTNVTTTGTTANATTAYTANYLLVGDGTSTPVSSSIYVNPSNGNVGIGNSNPSYNLDINGSGRFSGLLQVQGNLNLYGGNNSLAGFVTANSAGGGIYFGANGTNQNIRFAPTGSGFAQVTSHFVVEGAVAIGSGPLPNQNLRIYRPLSGGTGATGISLESTIQNDVTTQATGILSSLSTKAANFTLPNLYHFYIYQGTFGNGSSVTNQFGYYVGNNVTGAANNYGFYGNIPSSANNWNLYMAGSAKNYIAGNLGVGNLSPTEKLEVTGSIKQSGVTSSLIKADGTGKLVAATAGTDFVSSGTNTVGTIAKFTAAGTVGNSALTEAAITNGTGVKLDSKSAGYLAVGDFGAGTPMSIPAGYRLVVQDGIITEKVKVAVRNQTDWADYVFEPNYSLMPLNEVEQFVKENKHLPNVPSAEEMVEKGVEVGQTSKMFMEKIEELTLYMIELKKEIEALKAENARLKK